MLHNKLSHIDKYKVHPISRLISQMAKSSKSIFTENHIACNHYCDIYHYDSCQNVYKKEQTQG
jgi:hypothetical protein